MSLCTRETWVIELAIDLYDQLDLAAEKMSRIDVMNDPPTARGIMRTIIRKHLALVDAGRVVDFAPESPPMEDVGERPVRSIRLEGL